MTGLAVGDDDSSEMNETYGSSKSLPTCCKTCGAMFIISSSNYNTIVSINHDFEYYSVIVVTVSSEDGVNEKRKIRIS